MVTITFSKFGGFNKGYAFGQMQFSHKHLGKVAGMKMYKMMGSGAGNGFSVWPDFSTYSLLVHWEEESHAQDFFNNYSYWSKYTRKTQEQFTLWLSPTKTKGTWNGQNSFENNLNPYKEGNIAVLTRATIKPKYIPYFWRQVPAASKPVKSIPGHIYSKGVGEVPLMYQATVSMWEHREAMYDYAYRNKAHQDMIKMTRDLGWYSEEMFTEFNIDRISGKLFQ